MASTSTSLDPPTSYETSDSTQVIYMRDNVMVAYSVINGNDSYYFATSTEFNRIKPEENTVNDFLTQDLAYNYAYDISDSVVYTPLAVEIVDRNTRIPSGYFIVRPWYPQGDRTFWNLIATWPYSSKDVW
jgi:hypothetical protein